MDLCITGLSLLDLINLQSTLSQPPIVADEIFKPVLSNILNSYKMNTTTLRGKNIERKYANYLMCWQVVDGI